MPIWIVSHKFKSMLKLCIFMLNLLQLKLMYVMPKKFKLFFRLVFVELPRWLFFIK